MEAGCACCGVSSPNPDGSAAEAASSTAQLCAIHPHESACGPLSTTELRRCLSTGAVGRLWVGTEVTFSGKYPSVGSQLAGELHSAGTSGEGCRNTELFCQPPQLQLHVLITPGAEMRWQREKVVPGEKFQSS